MSNQFEREFRRAWRMKEADIARAHQLQGKTVASAIRLVALFFTVPFCAAVAVIVAVAVHNSSTCLDRQLSMITSELRMLQATRDRAAATGRIPAFLDRKIQVLRARRDELRARRDELREQRREEGFVVFPVGGGALELREEIERLASDAARIRAGARADWPATMLTMTIRRSR